MTDHSLHEMARHLVAQGDELDDTYLPPHVNGMAEDVVMIISAMETQWNYISGMVVAKTGLHYPSLEFVSKIQGVKITKKLFHLIRMAEVQILSKEIERGD